MTDAELTALRDERDRLRVELDEVRRQLLPHPDAKDGEDRGCGCDMYDAVTAAAWASAEIKRLRADVAALTDDRDWWKNLCQEATREGQRAMEICRKWQDVAEGN
jgi:hypothetical protein